MIQGWVPRRSRDCSLLCILSSCHMDVNDSRMGAEANQRLFPPVHPVILSSCHPVILSSCHSVIPCILSAVAMRQCTSQACIYRRNRAIDHPIENTICSWWFVLLIEIVPFCCCYSGRDP